MDKTSMTLGWLVGRQIAGMRAKKKTLVGYMYNDVGPYPEPPEEWDQDVYPFAFVGLATEPSFRAFSKPPLYCNTANNLIFENESVNQVYCYLTDGSWGDFKEATIRYMNAKNIHWVNQDVLNQDGTLYLAASEPIPVYE